MLNFGEKKIAFCVTKKINILTLELSGKKILNETKIQNPPHPLLQVKWSVPYYFAFSGYIVNVMHDWHIEVISPNLSNVTEYY
jgi:hypothetical protein